MTAAALLLATLRFAAWEAGLFFTAIRLANRFGRRSAVERWLLILAIQVTLESSVAALFSFAHFNHAWLYWLVLVGLACWPGKLCKPRALPYLPQLALFTPLILLSFRPVEEIDSINYLHFLIDWMGNRANPYTFASNYVAFWELSFLPTWIVTHVDNFFPLLALKAVALLALAAWLVGRELHLRRALLLWTVLGAILLQHLWYAYSGVPTLKNDVLHGAGFTLLTLVLLRAARRRLRAADYALLAFGATFAMVKYTGLILAGMAIPTILVLQFLRAKAQGRRLHILPATVAGLAFILLTSGHYYVRAVLLHGNPFYPFQINIAFLHLPGDADLSPTSILYHLHDPQLWRAFFLPASGLSPAGLLFPLALAAVLLVSPWRAIRGDWAAIALLAGWFLYFRSVFSAGVSPHDIGMLSNGLNSIRYVDGVLAVSELFLVALLARVPWIAFSLVGINLVSRLLILYPKIPLAILPWPLLAITAALALLLIWRRGALVAALCLLLVTPFVVERNRVRWTAYWNGLKPALAAVRGPSLAEFAGDYFAGHTTAAGNPVHPEVRSLLLEEMESLPPADRPRYLAMLPMPGLPSWRSRFGTAFANWGYVPVVEAGDGALLEREAGSAPASSMLEAWYVPADTPALPGFPVPGGRLLQTGDTIALASGDLVQLNPNGRVALLPASGTRIHLLNGGPGASYRWESGAWNLAAPRIPAEAPRWRPAISQGGFREESVDEAGFHFSRLRAENDADGLYYAVSFPESLPLDAPVRIRAMVRCPAGCVLAAAGSVHSAEKRIQAEQWTEVSLDFTFHRAEDPHYSIGINHCRKGDHLDVRCLDAQLGYFSGAGLPACPVPRSGR
jgi:hypothetical protein